jgi:soluble lytic murein transglycosylase-like protein
MTPRARLCLASGIGLLGIVSTLHLPRPGAAHPQTYVVQANDTLSAIALRFHSSLSQLMRLNGILDPDHLQVGQVLTVPGDAAWQPAMSGEAWRDANRAQRFTPASQTQTFAGQPSTLAGQAQTTTATSPATGAGYVVQPGDTLGTLSNRFGVSLTTLAAANGITHLDLVQVGQRLLIPAQALAGGPPPAQEAVPMLSATSTPAPASTTATLAGSGFSAGASVTAPATSQTSVGALLATAAQTYGVDPALVKAVAWQESGWRMVVASDGGIGVMQLMPATAAWVGPALLGRAIDPYNVADNIQAGVALLASYLRQYGGNVQLALAAYNEGPQNVARGILSSTAQYIANVLALRARFAS